ncbi:MAG: membrane or secreted protein [Croceivirga sp.]
MRNDILVFLFVFVVLSSTKAQSLIGAWETQIDANIEGNKTTVTLFFLFSKRHHVAAAYHTKTGVFMATFGGSYSLQDTTLTQTIEFDSENSDRIGKTKSYSIEFNDEELLIKGDDLKLKRIDKGTLGDLAGAWLISGRMRDGALQKRDTNRPRKTMKVLSGTRFQWIAYNTETKEFM